jgi:hypothetical protein
MKILITGASGNLGTLTRQLYIDHIVHLSSRKRIETKKNEIWIPSEDLTNHSWWSKFEYLEFYDIIFHYAEPVKKKISATTKKHVVQSHLNFLINGTKNSKIILYPMTAYKHDNRIISISNHYLQIKLEVYEKLSKKSNIIFPVFHPLIDFGDGLAKFVNFSKKIPLINIFSSFNASLPILYKSDLEKYITNVINDHESKPEVYSRVMPVSLIFNDNKKINSTLLSQLIFLFIKTLKNPIFYLLIHGRKIYR